MPVQYIHEVASESVALSFLLLRRWRGSVYKAVWKDMVVYLIIYYCFSFVYRFGLGTEGRRQFERLVLHCERFQSRIPMSFVLGFYVSLVVSRWWETYRNFPWPDNVAILAATHLPGQSDVEREERRSILRHVLLSITLAFSIISPVVKEMLPTLDVMVAKNYLTEMEAKILTEHEDRSGQHVAWVPIQWACKSVRRARQENRIATDLGQKSLIDEMLQLRVSCGRLLGYNSHNIPLVYAQVVTLAVYSFFYVSVLGDQFLDPLQNYEGHIIDLYVPVFPLLKLLFYLGWLKVAEALLNPFGSDDHDFDFVSLIDRHHKMVEMLGETTANDLSALSPSPEGSDAAPPAPHEAQQVSTTPVLCRMASLPLPQSVTPASCGVQDTIPLILQC